MTDQLPSLFKMVAEAEAKLDAIRVRTFRIDDYREVRALWKKSGLEIRPGDSRTEVQLKIRRDPELFLVAEAGDAIVGSVIGAWDGRRGWIYHLGVLPSFQRRGVATRLIREVERRMKKKGVVKVNASIYKWNKRSLAFFKAGGYESDTKTIHVGKYFKRARRSHAQ
jgi:ribosomal protein S18 acetylase RimI-like enzyme